MTVKLFPTPDAHLPDTRSAKPTAAVPAGKGPGMPAARPGAAASPAAAPARTDAKRVRGNLLDDLGAHLLDDPGHGLVLDQTAQLYPHIVNKLAVFWNDAEALDAYLNTLMFADRPGRAGLEFKVAAELAEVRDVRVRLLRSASPRR